MADKKLRKPRPQKFMAWMWLSYPDTDAKRATFRAFGNGRQYQLPVFDSRKDAVDWQKDGCGQPGLLYRLARVRIEWRR